MFVCPCLRARARDTRLLVILSLLRMCKSDVRQIHLKVVRNCCSVKCLLFLSTDLAFLLSECESSSSSFGCDCFLWKLDKL